MITFLEQSEYEWRMLSRFSDGFHLAHQWLKSIDSKIPLGRHTIDGESVFAEVAQYQPKALDQAVFESHRRYADIQIVLKGREQILVSDEISHVVIQPYEVKKDLEFAQIGTRYTTIDMFPGKLEVFFPADLHAPGIANVDCSEVLKLVIKVLL
ncbi:MAG: YhcH/YjgK/YiaL family protein [Opitutales bacterium]|nr:YhcH/YjgK/YiaL family protein [Opitutales bacterium]